MDLNHLIVAAECAERLGPDGLIRLAAALHPGRSAECQTCITPLDGTLTSLTIDLLKRRRDGIDDDAIAVARLHHHSCTRSRWNDSDTVVLKDNAATFSKSNFLITGRPEREFAMVVLNPGLDMVFIGQVDGQWTPFIPWRFRKAGMVSNRDSRYADGWPPVLTGVTARVLGGDAVQIIGPAEDDRFPKDGGSAAPGEMVRVMREQHRVFFVVTHAVNPAEIKTMGELQQVMDHPFSLVGTVPVHFAPRS